MTNRDFLEDVLSHSWGTKPEQKKREKEYNHQYYLKNKIKWLANAKRTKLSEKSTWPGTRAEPIEQDEEIQAWKEMIKGREEEYERVTEKLNELNSSGRYNNGPLNLEREKIQAQIRALKKQLNEKIKARNKRNQIVREKQMAANERSKAVANAEKQATYYDKLYKQSVNAEQKSKNESDRSNTYAANEKAKAETSSGKNKAYEIAKYKEYQQNHDELDKAKETRKSIVKTISTMFNAGTSTSSDDRKEYQKWVTKKNAIDTKIKELEEKEKDLKKWNLGK